MGFLTRTIIIAALVAPAIAAQEPEALIDEAGCNGCHQLEQTMLGPSYQAIAERYRGEAGAADTLFARMREGSEGVWGDTPMPPVDQDTLSDDEMTAVVDWVLSQ